MSPNDDEAPTPLFLVGSGRCGTTLLCQALAAHSQIGLTNESHIADFLVFMAKLAGVPDDERCDFHIEIPFTLRGVVGREFTHVFARLMHDERLRLFHGFYARWFPGRRLRYVGDKMPDPTAALSWLQAYPATKTLLLVRDPRDYVASARSYARRDDMRAAYPHLDVSIETMATHWRNVYRGALEVALPECAIRYERLVADAAVVIRETLAALGLAVEPACVAAATLDASFAGHATSQDVRASVGRWRRDLDDSQLDIVRAVCGEVAVRYGYDLGA